MASMTAVGESSSPRCRAKVCVCVCGSSRGARVLFFDMAGFVVVFLLIMTLELRLIDSRIPPHNHT